MINLNKYICIRPWTHIEIHCIGDELVLFPCCPSWINSNYGTINKITNLNNINTDNAKLFKESVLKNEYKYCKTDICPYINNLDLNVTKERSNINIEDLRLSFIHLCYDRTCNLRCPSCRKNIEVLTKKTNPVLYENVIIFQEKLIKFVNSYNRPLIIGAEGSGDPFASPLIFNLLQQFDGKNENLSFHFQSNGILFDKEHWDKLKNIHNPRNVVMISVDAGNEETYNKVRVGGNWNTLMKNLRFIKQLKDNNEISWVGLCFVVQYNNYKSIPEFIELCEELQFDPIFTKLLNWKTFTNEEYNLYDICNINHPNYNEYKKIINDIKNKNINLINIRWGNII